jgi:hypothetical protein
MSPHGDDVHATCDTFPCHHTMQYWPAKHARRYLSLIACPSPCDNVQTYRGGYVSVPSPTRSDGDEGDDKPMGQVQRGFALTVRSLGHPARALTC